MPVRLNANRVPYPIADLADLATILEIFSRPLTVVASVLSCSSSATPPCLHSRPHLSFSPHLWLFWTQTTSAQGPLPHLVLIASLFPFNHARHMFSCCDWHPVTCASIACLHFSRFSFACFHVREPNFYSVFTLFAMWHWAVLLS